MIAFFVITSILNLALGYALAVYLGSASRAFAGDYAPPAGPFDALVGRMGELPTADSIYSQSAGSRQMWEAAAAKGAAPFAGAPAVLAQATASDKPTHAAPDSEQDFIASATAVEQDLLAGIEEFRNQLSQLKGQGAPAEAPEALGPLIGR